MTKSLSFFFFATAAIAVVACSSSTNNNSSGGSCAGYVAAVQENRARCDKSTTSPEQNATATARLSTLCANALNAPGNGIQSGAIDACAAALKGTCDTPEACESLSNAVGTLPDGSPCGTESQCASGECKKAGSTSGCGTCAPLIPIGGACSSNTGGCVKGAACMTKDAATGATCVATPRLAEGEVCYDPSKPSSVRSSCATGLACKTAGSSATQPAKCSKRAAAGEACGQSGDCSSELRCVTGKCAPLVEDGGACASTSDCKTGACSKATKKCIPYEFGATGAACNGDEKRCARGSCSITATDGNEGTCVDPIPDGAACTEGESSSKGPRCDTYADCINGTCQLFDPATCK
jgi:hypothetical protein